MKDLIILLAILIIIFMVRFINKNYGIEKVEWLRKASCLMGSIMIFIAFYFTKDDTGRSGTLLESLVGPLILMIMYFFWNKRFYQGLEKESKGGKAPFSYLTFQMFPIVISIIIVGLSVVSIISFITTGSYQTILKTY